MDILTEGISATEVNKLDKMSTPKMMEIEYIGFKGGKEKRKYKVLKDWRSKTGRYRFFQLKDLKPVQDGESELLAAMKMISKTGNGPKEQFPSMGCSIKWFK